MTTPRADAASIARSMIDRRLAACVNVVALVKSIYRWEGEVAEDEESLLVVKTTSALVDRLDELLRAIHPYENFELISLDVSAGSHPYLQWLGDSVAPEP